MLHTHTYTGAKTSTDCYTYGRNNLGDTKFRIKKILKWRRKYISTKMNRMHTYGIKTDIP